MALPSPPRKQLQIIRSSLAQVQRALQRMAAELRKAEAKSLAQPPTNGKRKLHLSLARRRQLKVHGQYLGYVRQLKPAQKARVKKVKAKGGYRAAIALAKRLARG